MIYGIRSNGNNHGLVLTKPIVVETMLNRVGYSADNDLRDLIVIEPSAGDGAFAIEIIDRLYVSSLKFGFPFQKSLSNLVFFELDERMASLLSERVESILNKYGVAVPKDLVRVEDFLLSKSGKCDLLIGNPPYVRHENIPEEQKKNYRSVFSTFRHRSDLYIAFYEKGLRLLNHDGVLSFICSNRWLKNQYGQGLRDLIQRAYSLEEIIDLEGTCPFEEDVIAYPAITTIRNTTKRSKANYFKVDEISELNHFDESVESIRTINTPNASSWFSYESSGQNHEKFLSSIESQGFKIGIGVATGSDRVFIRSDFKELVENELLIPILTSRDLKKDKLNWSGNYILNPFGSTGQLIDLDKYPKARDYFESQKELLLKRHVAKKNPSLWYKTIDRIHPSLTHQVKVVLPDISGNTRIFIDKGSYYPHHNLYYITGHDNEKLIALAAILMSDFVKDQLLELGTTMNGGYPRWQSQNLKKLRIPILTTIPNDTYQELIHAYQRNDLQRINELVIEDRMNDYSFQVGQTRLFEPDSIKYG